MVKGRGQRISLFLYILSVLMRHLISDKKEVHYIHSGIHFIFDSNLLSFQKWVDCSKPWVLNFYFWGNGDIYSKVVKQCLAPYMKKCIKTYCVCVCVHIRIYKCSFFYWIYKCCIETKLLGILTVDQYKYNQHLHHKSLLSR